MQRVSALLPSWDKRKSSSSTTSTTKSSIERLFSASEKQPPAGLQRLSTVSRIAREDFWPATLDRECDRAARILKSFSTDGYLAPLNDEQDHHHSPSSEPQTPIQVFKRIPPRIIQNAAGIAIFTCMRSGLWMTGSGGSGILIARKADGTWSPPSGILLHTPTLSFIIGVDVYDCVLVINDMTALESLISRPKVTLGEDIGLTKGPLISLDLIDEDLRWRDLDHTVLTYLKARGQSQHVNLNGCILTERGNENDRFYSGSVTPMQIAAGNVSRRVDETRPLFEVIKAAEGRIDADIAIINQLAVLPSPGDAMIAPPRDCPATPPTPFGVPNADDPDPFGVLALEMAGLEIREAGTGYRPSSQLDYCPSPTSPVFSKFSRQSTQTFVSDSNRASYTSMRTTRTRMSDAYTQTDKNQTPSTTPNLSQSEDGMDEPLHDKKSSLDNDDEEVDYTKVDLAPLRNISGTYTPEAIPMTDSSTTTDEHSRTDVSTLGDSGTKASSLSEKEESAESRVQINADEDDADDEEDESDDDFEEPVIYEAATVQTAARTAVVASPLHAKGALVNIPRRIPPPLPTRSPARRSQASKSEVGDVEYLRSPLQASFTPSPRESMDAPSFSAGSMDVPIISEPTPTRREVSELPTTDNVVLAVDEEKTSETNASDEVSAVAEAKTQDLALLTPTAPMMVPRLEVSETITPPMRNPRRHSKVETTSTQKETSSSLRRVSVA